MKAKPKQIATDPTSDELRMGAGAFDQMMSGALQVAPGKLGHAAAHDGTRAKRKRQAGK